MPWYMGSLCRRADGGSGASKREGFTIVSPSATAGAERYASVLLDTGSTMKKNGAPTFSKMYSPHSSKKVNSDSPFHTLMIFWSCANCISYLVRLSTIARDEPITTICNFAQWKKKTRYRHLRWRSGSRSVPRRSSTCVAHGPNEPRGSG